MFLCTGNICRSPLAEVLPRAASRARRIDAATGSAGLLFDGRAAHERSRKVAAERGLDLEGFRSRTITTAILEQADLIIGMERRHVREAEVLAPGTFDRSFTLPEIVGLAAAAATARHPAEPLRTWAGALGAERSRADYLLEDRSQEIPDPIGARTRTYRACADTIDGHLDTLVELTWPLSPTPVPNGGIHADRDRR